MLRICTLIEVQSRYMRIIIMYDISLTDEEQVRKYNKFRNELYKLGYFRIQYSIYVKCISSHTVYQSERSKILKIIPKNSNVRIVMITEEQYQNIELLSGDKSQTEKFNDNERYLII